MATQTIGLSGIEAAGTEPELTELEKVRKMLAMDTSWITNSTGTGELPAWNWVPNDEWRSLEGILDGHPEHDTSKALHEERVFEWEHDERKFGPFSKR